MKKTTGYLALLFVLGACNNSASTTAAADSTAAAASRDSAMTAAAIQSPYAVTYSSKFAIDAPKNAESVLKIWKAFDNGDVSAAREFFADRFEANLSDGSQIKTTRDSTLAMVQAFRSSITSVTSEVNAVMAVKSTDKGDDHWVLIWGIEHGRLRPRWQ
ncbi:MAG TPA: hypothetical protein VNU70_07480 [Puia sp.]|nr:hypothetical protein [Puia sp.]